MDNTDLANVDFRLTQTTFSTSCHQNTSVNMDCVAVWTLELQPVGCQLFTDGSYYNYAGRSNGTFSRRNEMQADFTLSPASACKPHEAGSGCGRRLLAV